jgi:hypothetical protein
MRRLAERRGYRHEHGHTEDEEDGEELPVHDRGSPEVGGKSVTKIDATVRDTAQGVNAKVLELTRFVGHRYHSGR